MAAATFGHGDPTAEVFLKDTLEAAQSDAEQLVVERMHKRAAYIEQLEGVFRAIDVTGTGMIGEERLSEILMNPRVKAYFQTIDLDLHEGTTLFHLLANGEGEAREPTQAYPLFSLRFSA